MFFSKVVHNLQKIKYTNNNCYKKNGYVYYKLMQNKNKHHINNNCSKIQSVIIPYRLPRLIIKSENIEHKDSKDSNKSNIITYKQSDIKDIKDIKDNKYNTIVSSIIVGTTSLILVSSGIYSYILIKYIDLLICL